MPARVARSLMTPDFIKGFLVGIIIAVVFWYFFSQTYGLTADTASINPNY